MNRYEIKLKDGTSFSILADTYRVRNDSKIYEFAIQEDKEKEKHLVVLSVPVDNAYYVLLMPEKK